MKFIVPIGCLNDNPTPLKAKANFGEVIKWVEASSNTFVSDSLRPIPSTKTPGKLTFQCFSQDVVTQCISPLSTIEITINSNPEKPEFDTLFLCKGSSKNSIELRNIEGHTYKWYKTENNLIAFSNKSVEVSTTNSGQYKFLVSRLNLSTQCESDVNEKIISIIEVQKPEILEILPGLIKTEPPLNTIWYKNNEEIRLKSEPNLKLISPGIYSAAITYKGCISEMSENFYFLISNISAETTNQLKIYPNPIIGNLNIELKTLPSENFYIKIFNSAGELIKSIEKIYNKQVIDLYNLHRGLYFIAVYNNQKMLYYERFIKH